jgi:hypothetical protein
MMAIAALAWLIATASPARAQDESLERARAAFETGQSHYEKGEFAAAAAAFEKAYQARAFPQFLFNIGASYEKMRKYAEAVRYYQRYVGATDSEADRNATRKRIAVLEKEIERLAKSKPDPAEEPSQAVKDLAEVKIRGLVVIESKPQGATIYLDSKDEKPLGRTPWNGSLEGEHTVLLELEGYRPTTDVIAPAADKLVVLKVSMAEQGYLGFVEISSNIPDSDIYVDDKSAGVYQKTPWKGDLTPGKHQIWVTKEGYNEHFEEIEVVAGGTHKVSASLQGVPVGYINVAGPDVDRMSIYVDGELLCERGPCRKAVPEGRHTISVRRGDHKSFNRDIELQARTEVTVSPDLAEKPSRSDAIVAYVVAAAFAGGGLYALDRAQGIRDELRAQIDGSGGAVDQGVSQEDGRFTEARVWSAGGHAGLGLAAVTGALAIYYTFRDKGPPSTGTVDVKAVSIEPQVSPTYAGFGLGGRF